MSFIVRVVLMLVLVACASAAPARGSVKAKYRSVGVGQVSGGKFAGVGSLSSGPVHYTPLNLSANGIRHGQVTGTEVIYSSDYSQKRSTHTKTSNKRKSGGSTKNVRRWAIKSRG